MLVNEIIEYCQKKSKAYIDYPFGDIPICFKVNKKIFAEIYPLENDYKITLKRNTIYINKTVSDEIIYEMIDHSYDEVIKSFSKKVQKQILESKEV